MTAGALPLDVQLHAIRVGALSWCDPDRELAVQSLHLLPVLFCPLLHVRAYRRYDLSLLGELLAAPSILSHDGSWRGVFA